MKVSFYNIGCKVNFAETEMLKQQFTNQGHEIVEFGKPADITIINTCTVTHNADADSRKAIRKAIKRSPNGFICAVGCWAQLRENQAFGIEGLDAILGAEEKFNIFNIFDKFEKQSNPIIINSGITKPCFHTAFSSESGSRTRAVFKIQDGCDYSCTYCAVPYARGASRSLPFDEFLPNLDNLLSYGYKEIILTGINLGEYSDKNKRLIDILELIANHPDNFRVRISSIEPNLITKDIINIMKDSEKICPHFHIPLQSGSDKILKLMKRRYNTAYFKNLINNIKTEIPDCAIGIDVIAAFPGETNEDFTNTYNFLESLPASYLHVFTYSLREGTIASKMQNHVNDMQKKKRTQILRTLSDEMSRLFSISQINNIKKILPEKLEKGYFKGWTENYIYTHVKSNEEIKNNDFVDVKLKEIKGKKVIAERIKSQ